MQAAKKARQTSQRLTLFIRMYLNNQSRMKYSSSTLNPDLDKDVTPPSFEGLLQETKKMKHIEVAT